MADTDGGVILTWNVANWISVTIMAAIGFALVGLAQKVWQNRQGKVAS
jgi:hypothetical protein